MPGQSERREPVQEEEVAVSPCNHWAGGRIELFVYLFQIFFV